MDQVAASRKTIPFDLEDVRIRRVLANPAVAEAVQRLVAVAPVEAVVLFGSQARDDATSESDWDLCVLLSDDIEPSRYTKVTLWPVVAGLGEAFDVEPIRLSVFEAKRADPFSLSHEVARDGVVLYAAPGVTLKAGQHSVAAA
jgi:predicted nucleotidyltransferase